MFKYEHILDIINYNFNINAQIWTYAEIDDHKLKDNVQTWTFAEYDWLNLNTQTFQL